jgi:hypothetical protein
MHTLLGRGGAPVVVGAMIRRYDDVTMAALNEQFEPPGDEEDEAAGNPSPAASKTRSFWRTALLLTSSAALSGIAFAIWNRRSLARIRQEYESRAAQPGILDDDVID